MPRCECVGIAFTRGGDSVSLRPTPLAPTCTAHVAKLRGVHLRCRHAGAPAQLPVLDPGLGHHTRQCVRVGARSSDAAAAASTHAYPPPSPDTSLIVSDGSEYLFFWDPVTLAETRRVAVTDADGRAVNRLNELEYIHGWVVANICEGAEGGGAGGGRRLQRQRQGGRQVVVRVRVDVKVSYCTPLPLRSLPPLLPQG